MTRAIMNDDDDDNDYDNDEDNDNEAKAVKRTEDHGNNPIHSIPRTSTFQSPGNIEDQYQTTSSLASASSADRTPR